MGLYRYKVVDNGGKILKGKMGAPSPAQFKKNMEESNLSLISYSRSFSFVGLERIKPRILMDFCLHLKQFEEAGIPLKTSLESVSQTHTTPRLREVAQAIITDMERGNLFSKSLTQHPSIFDSVFVGLISVGEKTGSLPFVLQQLFEHLKWRDEIQAHTRKALQYPLLMAGVLLSAIFILLTTLVPELVGFVENFTKTLPFSTHVLIVLSTFAAHHLPFLTIGMGSVACALTLLFKLHPKGAYWKDHLLNGIPLIGPLRHKIALTRFCHTFAVMFENGIDILQALQTARQHMSSGKIRFGLEQVEQFIQEGVSLSEAFRRAKIFPPLVIQMIDIGEKTSSLHKMLFHVKEHFDTTLKRQVEHTIGLLEPLMILCFGSILIWIVCAIFLPLYDLFLITDY
jgi:type IV pilus assembly protein PilC